MAGPDADLEIDFEPIDFGYAPFSSERRFVVWKYHVSKRRLMLRSPVSAEYASRVDVHFGAVSLMVLRDSYEGLQIREGVLDEVSKIEARHGVAFDAGATLNILGPGLNNFVVSGKMQWYEEVDPRDESGVFGLG